MRERGREVQIEQKREERERGREGGRKGGREGGREGERMRERGNFNIYPPRYCPREYLCLYVDLENGRGIRRRVGHSRGNCSLITGRKRSGIHTWVKQVEMFFNRPATFNV